jgi:predicted small secreted protein
LLPLLTATLLAACATTELVGPPRKETVVAVTDAAELITFNAGQPQRILKRQPLQGLPTGERLVGIDYRVARGVLFGLSAAGRLYTIDAATGALKPVGSAPPAALQGSTVAMNFNPVADRIRVVSDSGLNLRLHPDTGAVAATDPALAYAPGDARAGQAPTLAAAAYTYNKRDDKLTTNYAIDRAAGTLVTQGSAEGVQPVVSPNTGLLRSVGALGTGPVDAAALDIADTDNTALAALRQNGRTRLHLVDLASGRATVLGTVGDGRPLWGIAIAP